MQHMTEPPKNSYLCLSIVLDEKTIAILSIRVIYFYQNKLVSVNFKVIAISITVQIWSRFYHLDSTCQEIILIFMTFVVLKKKLGKTFKNCFFRTLFRKKQGQHEPKPKIKFIFL